MGKRMSASERWERQHAHLLTGMQKRVKRAERQFEAARERLMMEREGLEMLLDARQSAVDRAEEIIHEVCFEHDILWDSVSGPGRARGVVNCRSEICYRLMTEAKLGPSMIGRILNRHHASVIYLASRWAFMEGLHDPTNNEYERKMLGVNGLKSEDPLRGARDEEPLGVRAT